MKKEIRFSSFSVLTALVLLVCSCANTQTEPDLLIFGTKVFIDKETGFKNLDIAIKDDKIIFIGNAASQDFKTQNVINYID
jgi:urease alpha subunit